MRAGGGAQHTGLLPAGCQSSRAQQLKKEHSWHSTRARPPTHLCSKHGGVLDDGLPHAPVLVGGQVLHRWQQRLRQQLDADDLRVRGNGKSVAAC